MNNKQGIIVGVAKLKGCSMSARKMRLVTDIVRGLPIDKALAILKFTRKEAAVWLYTLFRSAVANWRVNAQKFDASVEPEDSALIVGAIWADQAPSLKRFQPAPHGRAHRIRKHYCHATIEVINTVPVVSEQTATANTSAEELDLTSTAE